MPIKKILIRKEKKELVDGREIPTVKRQIYTVSNTETDFTCTEGLIKKQDLNKKHGSLIKTNKGKEFRIISPSFIDTYRQIKRGAQIVQAKDIAAIIAETGLGKNSTVVDSGSGSGAMACFLAYYAKKVYTYEIRDDFIKIVKKNISMLGLKNITVEKHNIYEGIPQKNIDVITLDLPEPWHAIKHAAKSLKPGGFLVSYSPCIPQVSDFADHIRKSPDFIFLKAIEITEREWEADKRKLRPKTIQSGHTGFLVFARKIT